MSSKLQKSLSDYNSTLVKEGEILYGNLGTFIGGRTLVSVPGRAGYVYVRLRTKLSELIEAFNSEVAQKYNTPVLIERKGNRYVVVGRNTETFSDWETNDPYIPQHAPQHIFDKDGGNMGGDPVWVYPYQFMPSLVTPFGSRGAANVFLHSYPLHTENGWKYVGNTGTPRLTNYNPESGATLVLIALDAQTGNPALFATTGTFIPESVTGTSQLISYLPQVSDLRYLPDSFVRLVSGTSSIGWNNIYDVRQFLSYSPSGTSSLSVNGSSGIDNLVVTGADFAVTGSYAYLEFTGSTGSSGVSDHEALSGLLGGSVNDHWHMTPSQMIGLVSGTSTALHSHAGGGGGADTDLLKNYITGLKISNNGTDPTNDIDIAPGQATNSTNVDLITLSSTLVKRLDASWAVGTNQGGLDTGSIADTTYHVWAIKRSDTGVVDVLFSTSASAPTMPTNYDYKRRIGSIVRASSAIKSFIQDGDDYQWLVPVSDVSATNPGTSAVTRTLTLPTGIRIKAKISVVGYSAASGGAPNGVFISDLSITDTAPNGLVCSVYVGDAVLNPGGIGSVTEVWTNTSAQVRSRVEASNANTTLYIATQGWKDRREQDG